MSTGQVKLINVPFLDKARKIILAIMITVEHFILRIQFPNSRISLTANW